MAQYTIDSMAYLSVNKAAWVMMTLKKWRSGLSEDQIDGFLTKTDEM